ncbi:hypothetical protein [Rheinheimera maricola]|uniref:Transporter substrate-binding domain-containing protein n=1 Tax=Rheinheimera maricola TaxID=2793282 RepID=A0ABS7XCW5_9GAMM|nr:hypothetical protein [Rheinheimera maricola]MBZ9612452.1 hypothetical protein [Rheinheimera maricola]
MINRRGSLLLLVIVMCQAAVAAPKQHLVFSHSGHPVTRDRLIPLLQEVYGNLGYQLTFQEADGARALKLLNDGLVDGDVGRLAPLLSKLDNAAPVVLLDTVQVVLYCRPDLPCDSAVLLDPKQRVLVPTQDATLQILTSDIQAKRYFNSDWHNIIVMFNAGKVDYLVWIESDLLQPPKLENANRSETNIGPFGLYHILHKKHQQLGSSIAVMLSKQLNQLGFNLEQAQ